MNQTPDPFSNNCITKRLKVNGIVQGVGFRPFVFQLAQKYELKGEVANTSSGVAIHVEDLAEFIGDVHIARSTDGEDTVVTFESAALFRAALIV